MVGSAVTRALKAERRRLLTVDRADLDLTNQRDVRDWVQQNQSSSIIFCAAKVGRTMTYNTLPADFSYDNLYIQVNTINAAHLGSVNDLMLLEASAAFLGLYNILMRPDRKYITNQLFTSRTTVSSLTSFRSKSLNISSARTVLSV